MKCAVFQWAPQSSVPNLSSIGLFSSLSWQGMKKEYQIVITDVKGHHSTSQKFAQKIYDKLMTDYYDYGFYIWLEFSGVGPPSAWKRFVLLF